MQADNLRIPALIVKILAWAVVAFAALAALSQGAWLISYTQLADSPLMLVVAGFAGILSNLAFFPSIIAVMIWTYMAHENLHKAGLSGLNYSPAWATFSFIVPIVNLWIPFKAMRELANRSAGEPEELAEAEVDAVMSWWGCWIGSMVVGCFVVYTMVMDAIPGVFVTTPFWAVQGITILANILTALSAFFLIQVVKLITDSQRDGVSVLGTFE